MPTVVLVEDEGFERSSIINFIDWDLIGIKIIGEAANGSQGLATVLELKPDILITDVKMPVMDGIELARRVRLNLPDVKILFLSSYDDFEYAHQAIELNISAYIMKPVKESELLRTVKRVADEIVAEKIERRIQKRLHNKYEVSINLARQALVNRILTGLPVKLEDARQLGLEWLLSPSQNLCLIMSIFETDDIAHAIDVYSEHLDKQCMNFCARAINICTNSRVLITLCLGNEDFSSNINDLMELLKGFFLEKGADKVRMESLCSVGFQEPSDLYRAIIQKNEQQRNLILKTDKAKSKQKIADEVEAIILEQYHKDITLESIAKSLYFTPNYLSSVFKSIKKISVNRFLLKTRIDHAKKLLKDTDMLISEIANKCGYGNSTYFYKTFKTDVNLTPSEYRDKYRGK